MTRLHSSLLLLAVVAILTTGAPAIAGPDQAPAIDAAAAPASWLDTELCPETPATPPAALELAVPPTGDFILCTCQFCKYHPDTECQISPKGYSILCADWYRRHC